MKSPRKEATHEPDDPGRSYELPKKGSMKPEVDKFLAWVKVQKNKRV